jgi:hypothetical protein
MNGYGQKIPKVESCTTQTAVIVLAGAGYKTELYTELLKG